MFQGRLDSNEEMTGKGSIDLADEQIYYEGGFNNSEFHGRANLLYKDTLNQFQGDFQDHLKHGKATFIIERGLSYKGEFAFGVEKKNGG